jgi:hypothetical protein
VPAARNFRARAEPAPPDIPTARRLSEQAERHLASASISGVDADSRFCLLYDGARKSSDAIMRAAGRRVTTGAGHHIVYLAEAKRLLGSTSPTMWTRIEGARSIRNDIEYQAREATQLEVAELDAAAHELVAAAKKFVDDAS